MSLICYANLTNISLVEAHVSLGKLMSLICYANISLSLHCGSSCLWSATLTWPTSLSPFFILRSSFLFLPSIDYSCSSFISIRLPASFFLPFLFIFLRASFLHLPSSSCFLLAIASFSTSFLSFYFLFHVPFFHALCFLFIFSTGEQDPSSPGASTIWQRCAPRWPTASVYAEATKYGLILDTEGSAGYKQDLPNKRSQFNLPTHNQYYIRQNSHGHN